MQREGRETYVGGRTAAPGSGGEPAAGLVVFALVPVVTHGVSVL